ncbi:hypothetical protein [Paenarthrobacter sp. A20]|uniref:hypothetical protein n=1 Tax=Paenarthrobacter sp. A20 TaxID=2817891 RepID=UPI00209E5826|nr:hypothetical protein [Paenarthrobacter sp. A20]MCP1414367.1 hypothetical protein [Paenarthrobacter sp. A20]
MSAVKISVEIDGEQHDISECAWFFISPCGCTHGVTTVKDYDNGGWITTPEAAHVHMTPSKAVREQDIARGEKIEIGLRSGVTHRLSGDCPHTPQWGRAELPQGTEWGRAQNARNIHIVDEAEDADRIDWDYRTPRCGGRESLFEIHRSVVGDAPMCKKCLALVEPVL